MSDIAKEYLKEREITVLPTLSNDESLLENKLPVKNIFAFGATKVHFSSRISLLDKERLSHLRFLILTNEAIYIFDDDQFNFRVPLSEIKQMIKHKAEKSSRLLLRTSNGLDLLIICKTVSSLVEAIQKVNIAELEVKEVEPNEDLFHLAKLADDLDAYECKLNTNELRDHLEKALEEKKDVLLYLELLRRKDDFDWEGENVVNKAVQYVKSL
ncbi:hypothetical protein ABK040_013732 [Willaertia magna]